MDATFISPLCSLPYMFTSKPLGTHTGLMTVLDCKEPILQKMDQPSYLKDTGVWNGPDMTTPMMPLHAVDSSATDKKPQLST